MRTAAGVPHSAFGRAVRCGGFFNILPDAPKPGAPVPCLLERGGRPRQSRAWAPRGFVQGSPFPSDDGSVIFCAPAERTEIYDLDDVRRCVSRVCEQAGISVVSIPLSVQPPPAKWLSFPCACPAVGANARRAEFGALVVQAQTRSAVFRSKVVGDAADAGWRPQEQAIDR